MSNRECSDGFIDSYMHYQRFHGAPAHFHWWTAIALVASALGRRVNYKVAEDIHIYPNLYMMFVAPTTRCHKSTTINMGFGLFREAFPHWSHKMFAEQGTPEALIDAALDAKRIEGTQGDAEQILCVPEFATLFGNARRDAAMLYLLTDWYECPPSRKQRTRGKGTKLVVRPCINLQTASTPTWLRETLPRDALFGGFGARVLYVWSDTPQHTHSLQWIKRKNQAHAAEFDALREALLADLTHIGEMRGEYELDPIADEWYEAWCMEQGQEHISEELMGLHGRMPTTILKLGIILRAQQDDEPIIRVSDLHVAEHALRELMPGMRYIVEAIHMTDEARKQWLVERRIESLHVQGKRVTYARLLRALSGSVYAPELKVILETLKDAKRVRMEDGELRLVQETDDG